MPLRDDLPAEEQDDKPWWKFPDCAGCANRMKKRICDGCDNGEFFEEPEPEGIDNLFGRNAW